MRGRSSRSKEPRSGTWAAAQAVSRRSKQDGLIEPALYKPPIGAASRDGQRKSWATGGRGGTVRGAGRILDRKSTRLNSSHLGISYAVFCLKKKFSLGATGVTLRPHRTAHFLLTASLIT